MRALSLVSVLAACTPVDTDTPGPQPELDPVFSFSFAVIADPHVTREGENAARFRDALDWVNANAAERHIEVLLVAGDVAWGDGFGIAVDALMGSDVPAAVINGDNTVNAGDERAFSDAFVPYYDDLATRLDGWDIAPRPVYNPVEDQDSWFNNFTFTHNGVRFVGVDWSPRISDPIWQEMAFPNDFEGGSLPFLADTLATTASDKDESVVILSHQPMYRGVGGFTSSDWDDVSGVVAAHGDKVAMNVAGHLHVNGESTVPEAQMDLYVTDATWDDDVTVRVFDVYETDTAVTYGQGLVVVPR